MPIVAGRGKPERSAREAVASNGGGKAVASWIASALDRIGWRNGRLQTNPKML
jgi:hypothetical protein